MNRTSNAEIDSVAQSPVEQRPLVVHVQLQKNREGTETVGRVVTEGSRWGKMVFPADGYSFEGELGLICPVRITVVAETFDFGILFTDLAEDLCRDVDEAYAAVQDGDVSRTYLLNQLREIVTCTTELAQALRQLEFLRVAASSVSRREQVTRRGISAVSEVRRRSNPQHSLR